MKLLEQQKLERLATKINRTAQNISVTVHNDITKATALVGGGVHSALDVQNCINESTLQSATIDTTTPGDLNLSDKKVQNIVIHLDVVNVCTATSTTTVTSPATLDDETSHDKSLGPKLNSIIDPKSYITKSPQPKNKLVARKKSISQLTPAQNQMIAEEERKKQDHEKILLSVNDMDEDARKLILGKIEKEYNEHR